jgi:single-strand DNA-binding protein
MTSINKVILIGHAGKDPDIRESNGKTFASFTVATSEGWKDKATNEWKSKTEWHKVVVYHPYLATKVRDDLKKGTPVYVEGSLQTRKWTDKNGHDNYTTEVVVQGYSHQLIIFGLKGEKSEPEVAQTSQSKGSMKDFYNDIDDELPY